MINEYIVSEQEFTGLANAVRKINGGTETMSVSEMTTSISNMSSSGGSVTAVLYTEQNLTDSQKARARTNIGAMSADTALPTVPENVSAFANDAGYLADTDLPYVTPQMFGAKADGVTDDTKAINDAIEAAENGGIVYFPEGTYKVSSSSDASLDTSRRYYAVRICKKENLKLILAPKAHIKHRVQTEAEILAGNRAGYYVVGILNSKNIKIIGGKIEGEADEHVSLYKDNTELFWYQGDGTYSRCHGHGIGIRNSENVLVQDCEIFNCFGDSIIIGTYDNIKSKHVVVENCNLHNSMRQGISVTGADYTTIRNCKIHNIGGCSPQSGIDFEPNYVEDMNINSVVENCIIHDCLGYSIVSAKANRGTKIRDCKLYTKVCATCDDTYPIEYINCDMICYQSSNAYRNTLHNCRIASVGMYEVGDDFHNCMFSPNLFDYVIDNYSNTIPNLIEAGTNLLATSSARFYQCEFVINNSTNYADNFMFWRNNGKIGEVLFNDCNFSLGSYSKGIKIETLQDVALDKCVFKMTETQYTGQFVELKAPNALRLKDCVIDAKTLSTYKQESLLRLYSKNTYIEGNQFLATSKICSYPITQTFIDQAGELYVLRNYMPSWGAFGNLEISSALKFISSGNIISTTQNEVSFTEQDKMKLDNIGDVISESGFITEEEAKKYTDTKIANVSAQIVQQTPLFANSIEECTDETKVYVLPDGNIYCNVFNVDPGGKPLFDNVLTTAIDSDETIYNGTGYRNGYKLDSAGIEVQDTSSKADVGVTGFIPCEKGDIFKFKNIHEGSSNSFSQYRADFTKCGNQYYWKALVAEEDGTYTLDTSTITVNSQTAYIRFSFGEFNENSAIARNEELVYTQPSSKQEWTNTGHSFVAIVTGEDNQSYVEYLRDTVINPAIDNKADKSSAEDWTFTLEDGSTVTKKVVLG